MAQLLWKMAWQFLITTLEANNNTVRYTPKGNEKLCLQKYLYESVYKTFIK